MQVDSRARIDEKEKSMCKPKAGNEPPRKEVSGLWVLLIFAVLFAVVIVIGVVTQ